MEIGVLLFGPAAAAAGTHRLVVHAPSGATCASILKSLAAAEPRLQPIVEPEGAARLAVNHAFAPPQQVIQDGDEVALIAMVSGG